MGRTRPALDAGFFIFRTDFSEQLAERGSEVPPGAGRRFFDNRMRQWQTLTPAKALVCANHKFLNSVTCQMASLPGTLQKPAREEAACAVSFMVKLLRAYGGCLGANRRRRTWQAAKSFGEPQAGFDPEISEWGNPHR